MTANNKVEFYKFQCKNIRWHFNNIIKLLYIPITHGHDDK